MAINIHLLCANTLERNFADAYSVLVSLLPQSSDWVNYLFLTFIGIKCPYKELWELFMRRLFITNFIGRQIFKFSPLK